MRRFPVPLVFLLLLSLATGALIVTGIGSRLVAPQPRQVGNAPAWLVAETVAITRRDGGVTAGWFVQGRAGMPAVVLLHPIRADRRSMLGRARLLSDAGYSVLLIDLQAHGETPGPHIGLGVFEAADAHAAVDYLRLRLPGNRIGVIGASLGGAAALLGDNPVAADALVLESVYTDIEQAIGNRLAIRFGRPGRLLTPLLTWQIGPRLGIALGSLAPVEAIRRLDSPVLLISGAEDRHTLGEDARRLYAAANEPRELWLVQGAAHEDLHAFAPVAYEARVLGFLHRHLEVAGD
jgi:fermentation-respiration switch protein FrsA (DUF1100 family)